MCLYTSERLNKNILHSVRLYNKSHEYVIELFTEGWQFKSQNQSFMPNISKIQTVWREHVYSIFIILKSLSYFHVSGSSK